MAKLVINSNKRRFPTAPSLYGLFFEDINRSADGGLYPELIRNRAFDDSCFPEDLSLQGDDLISKSGWLFEYQRGEGQKKWKDKLEPTDIPGWYSQNAHMELDKKNTLNEKREAAISVEFEKGGRIYNVGFSGIPVKLGSQYNLYFFAKVEEDLELEISIESDDEKICMEKVLLRGQSYKRYDISFSAKSTSKNARLYFNSPNGGKFLLGFTSLMPADTFKSNGLRKDLCEKLKDLNPGFLRFPGGCIVEGFSKSTAQRFKRMVGPVWEREGFLNMWGYRSTEGLGFHEYLQLAEDLQTDALYVCNVGMTCQARNCILMDEKEVDEYLDDALCALEYAMGDKSTKWGSLRAEMGHPEPFALKYLELGNENNGKDYEERYEKFYKEIHSRYLDLIIIANTHVEEVGLPLDIADEHFYDKTEWFAQNSHYYDGYDRNGPKIFVGEYAVVSGNIRTLYTALGEAMFMIGMERNQDIVKLSAYAPLFENVNYAAWEPNLIAFDGLDNYGIPSYYVAKLFAENKGEYVLESGQQCSNIIAPYLKGGPCLIGSEGVNFKNPVWNNEPAKANIEMFGKVNKCEDGSFITVISENDPSTETAKRFEMEGTVLITMSDDEVSNKGVFEIEILAQEDKEIGIGMFASPYGKARSSEDSPYNLFTVQPIRWVISNGMSRLLAGVGFRMYELTEAVPVNIENGGYHKLRMETDGVSLKCSIDGVKVMEIDLPNYEKIQTIAIEDGNEIIIKAVNIADEIIPIEVSLDCEVESDYQIGLITGDPSDKNTLDNPMKVAEHWSIANGGAANFTYNAPASSISVLRLKKI